MPQVFRVGPYLVYFWTNESNPPEPIHVHVTDGTPSKDDTKVWITQSGGALVCHNKGDIPDHRLNDILDVVASQSGYVVECWKRVFGEVRFYC